MDMLQALIQKKSFKRLIIFALIAVVLYFLRDMINLILLTFIFTFLMDRLVKIVTNKIPINRKLTVIVLYCLIVGLLSLGIVKYLPVIAMEISQLVKQLTAFYTQPHHNKVWNYVVSMINSSKLSTYLEHSFTFIVNYFTGLGKVFVQVLLSLLLSLFFLLEKQRLIDFTKKFKHSKIAPFYNEIEFFAEKFIGSFGKVIEAQFIIAIVNCVLTVISLSIMHFPQLFGLAILIFFLGLIPVAGVIIGFVPLGLIAYSIGGGMKVLYVVITIVVIHAIETYILNPKLMSSKTNLPIFYTFIVLIFSEHFFGVWGLIIGIPIFMFLLDVLDVTSKEQGIKNDRKQIVQKNHKKI